MLERDALTARVAELRNIEHSAELAVNELGSVLPTDGEGAEAIYTLTLAVVARVAELGKSLDESNSLGAATLARANELKGRVQHLETRICELGRRFGLDVDAIPDDTKGTT